MGIIFLITAFSHEALRPAVSSKKKTSSGHSKKIKFWEELIVCFPLIRHCRETKKLGGRIQTHRLQGDLISPLKKLGGYTDTKLIP
jgi:hypothetical protein